MAKGVVPDVLVLVLNPRTRFRVQSRDEIVCVFGTTRLIVHWRTVELWELPLERLLAIGDVGLLPLVPLTKYDDQPEAILRDCKKRIDAQAEAEEHDSLLVVAQVLASLRFDRILVQTLLGGGRAMTEYPIIVEIEAKRSHKLILAALEARFANVPESTIEAITKVTKEKKLVELNRLAATCKDLATFTRHLKA